jgi:hypothetical protein
VKGHRGYGIGKSRLGVRAVATAALLAMSYGSASAVDGVSDLFRSFFYGGSVPPSGPGLASEIACPAVTIAPGGAAINSYAGGRAGGPETLRSQISITDVARECIGRPDGPITVKVGVEGRALIGPGGSSGRFEAPVRFAIKQGEKVLVSTSRRASVALAPGQTQGTFIVVEETLVVPPGAGDFDIEVGLGGAGAAARPARRAR